MIFHNAYKGKAILITGHTGLRDSRLAMWMKRLEAKVVGYSAYYLFEPCNFSVCGLFNLD